MSAVQRVKPKSEAIYKPKTMLDSGAFSAWYRGDQIDLDSYLDFIDQHKRRFCAIVALDMIPGESGTAQKSAAASEAAARQSHRNFVYMRKHGVDAIPVFHQGEDFKWLGKMLDERIPYIGISPYLMSKEQVIIEWMDRVFTFISDAKGRPLCKTHGFGVTGHSIVRRYPWYSVDSTSWALSAGYGNILMPRWINDGPDFTHPVQFNISERDRAGNNSMLHLHPKGILRGIADRYFDMLGLTFTEVRNFQESRLIVNAAYFQGLERQLMNRPFAHRLRGWTARPYAERACDFDYKPRIHLATMMKIHQQGVVLSNMGVEHRLISYFDCRKFDPDKVEEYTTNGFVVRDKLIIKRAKSMDLRRRMHLLKRLAAQTQTGEEE